MLEQHMYGGILPKRMEGRGAQIPQSVHNLVIGGQHSPIHQNAYRCAGENLGDGVDVLAGRGRRKLDLFDFSALTVFGNTMDMMLPAVQECFKRIQKMTHMTLRLAVFFFYYTARVVK